MQEENTSAKIDEFEKAISFERFSRYIEWSGGDKARAYELYTLNTQLAESLYTPLQVLEITLRNRIHTILQEKYGDWWFEDTSIMKNPVQEERVQEVKARFEEKAEYISGDIVSALSFGFWTSMLGKDEENLWQQGLYKIALPQNGINLTRKKFSSPLAPIRTLRNRIAHHEPIINWDLKKHHSKIIELTEYLSPVASDWCQKISRFDQIYPEERIKLIK